MKYKPYEKNASNMIDKAWEYTEIKYRDLLETANLKFTAERPDQIRQFESEYESTRRSSRVKLNYEEHLDEIIKDWPKNDHLSEDLEQIARLIDYIPMSPDKEPEHMQTYITNDALVEKISTEALLSSSTVQPINISRHRLRRVMSYWKDRAMQLAGKEIKKTIYNDVYSATRFIIRGKQGLGKTALLNYLFSVNADSCLFPNEIMWIRIQLDSMKEIGLKLQGKIYAKFLKVFCKDYLDNVRFPFKGDFLSKFELWVTGKANDYDPFELIKCDIGSIVKKYIKMLSKIKYEASRNPLKKVSSIYEESGFEVDTANQFTIWLLSYIQNIHHYGYIFIIDGLDNIFINWIQRNFFREWMSKIDSVTNNLQHVDYRAIYVCVMRDYSVIDFYKNITKETILNRFIEFRVDPQPLGEIVNAKCIYAARRLRNEGTFVRERTVQNIIMNTLKMVFIALRIKFKIESLPHKRRLIQLFNEFSPYVNDNFRATMRIIRVLVTNSTLILEENAFSQLSHDRLSSETIKMIIRRDWLIYRMLLIGGFQTKLFKNKVKYKEITRFETDATKSPIFMSINNNTRAIIPNIFNFCEVNINNENVIYPKNLFKLRIIQFLMSNEGRAHIKDAIGWYKDQFTYAIEELRHEIREMVFTGLINPDIREDDVLEAAIGERNYPISMSPLAQIIFNKLLDKSVYYETVCNDTPIQNQIASRITPLSRTEVHCKSIELADYLKIKTKSVILFILYLMLVEKEEAKYFKGDKQLFIDRYLIFNNERLSKIKEHMARYVSGYLWQISNSQSANVDDYVSDWFDFFEVPTSDR